MWDIFYNVFTFFGRLGGICCYFGEIDVDTFFNQLLLSSASISFIPVTNLFTGIREAVPFGLTGAILNASDNVALTAVITILTVPIRLLGVFSYFLSSSMYYAFGLDGSLPAWVGMLFYVFNLGIVLGICGAILKVLGILISKLVPGFG